MLAGRDLRLVVVAAAVWGGALPAVLLPGASAGIAIGGVCAVLALLGALVLFPRLRRLALLCVVLAAVLLVSGRVAGEQPSREAALSHAQQAGVLTMTVSVTGKVERAWLGAFRFSGDAAWDEGRVSFRIPVTVVFRGEPPRGVDFGSRVSVSGRVTEARAGESAVLVLQADEPPEARSPPQGLFALAAGIRAGFAAEAAALPSPGGALLPGLVVGDTDAVPEELDQAMKSSSLAHVTAVSGSNCALIVGAAFGIAALLGLPRGVRVAVGLIALLGFVVLVTPEPSVLRAAAMASAAMLALLMGRARDGLGALALAVVVLLVADPHLAVSLGFALSVIATAALLLVAAPMSATLSRAMPRFAALALAVPLSAQLACAPLLLVVDPRISLYGVAANVMAAPAVPLATVLGMLACLTLAIPPLSFALTVLAWIPSAWIASTAELFARLPGGSLPWGGGPPAVLALAAICAALAVLLSGVRRRGLRLVSAAVVSLAVGVLGGGWAVDRVIAPAAIPRDWEVAMCDIGQGDAVLVRAGSFVALIDTGPDPAPLRACLDELGVPRLDLLVLTHFDLDHVGGTAAVEGRVGTVLHGPVGEAGEAERIRRLTRGGATAWQASAGMSGALGEARWRMLWPRAGSPGGNDGSLVMELVLPSGTNGLFLGDLGAQAQHGLLASGSLAPHYTVVKVSHHGSGDQDPQLYSRLSPTIALISVGAGNRYGHPRENALALLAASGARVARTDREGMVLVARDGDGVSLWHERSPP